jgi:PAT family beta-lactamase induction signal transducer AmpG
VTNSSISKSWPPLASLLDRRFLIVLLIGFCSGFPWVLHGSMLTLWLRNEGVTRTTVGLFGAVATMYAINWLWAPLIDRVRIPVLTRHFGQRRSWLLLCQALLVVLMLLMSTTDPTVSLGKMAMIALGFAIASATQDVAIDSYRVLLFRPEEKESKLPFASALATAGWYSGYGFIGGTLALYLAGETVGLPWAVVYQVLAALTVIVMVLLMLIREMEEGRFAPTKMRQADYPQNDAVAAAELETSTSTVATRQFSWGGWLLQTLVAPFREFFQRCGVQLGAAILLFIFTFHIGEAMLGRMSLVFYDDLGFTTNEIAFYNKFVGGLFTVVCSVMGAMITTRYGIIRGMLVGGIAMASSNLLYAVMSWAGPVPWLFLVTLLVDNFCTAFVAVAKVSFISYFTSRTFTGTQYALMVALSNFGRTSLASYSGAVVDSLNGNWAIFFVLTTLAVIPSLCVLWWLAKLLGHRQQLQ